jgi:Putative DNA-binding domain
VSHASLAEQQAALADVLRRTSSLSGDEEAASIATAIAAGNDRLSPTEQVDIYREQYFLRHIDVLREDFASLEHILGDEAFGPLARAYLAAHPPRSFTLRDLGHAMAQFLGENAPWRADPLLGDLARIEWAFVEAFDAPAAPFLEPTALAAIPEEAWPDVRLALQPSLQRLALAFPAHEYRLAVHNHEHPGRPEPRPSFVVVYRGPEALHSLELSAEPYALLDELARGTALGDACERAAPTSGAAIAGWFQQWTSLGWISRVENSSELRGSV